MIKLSDSAIRELNYLLENFDSFNGYCIRPSLSLHRVDFSLSSDSSNLGTALYEVSDSNEILLKRVFTKTEMKEKMY